MLSDIICSFPPENCGVNAKLTSSIALAPSYLKCMQKLFPKFWVSRDRCKFGSTVAPGANRRSIFDWCSIYPGIESKYGNDAGIWASATIPGGFVLQHILPHPNFSDLVFIFHIYSVHYSFTLSNEDDTDTTI